MSEPVKSRTYRSSVREQQARRTRQAILGAARRRFAEQGYAVWSMNSAEYFTLLVRERGWDTSRFAAWLSDAWIRLFLASPEA